MALACEHEFECTFVTKQGFSNKGHPYKKNG
jgi:hypothetical protein